MRTELRVAALAFILLCTNLQFAFAQVDCSVLDPRASVSNSVGEKISASVGALYRIAKVGGNFESKTKTAIENLQKNVPISEQSIVKLRTLYLFCGMVANADDISTERKVQLYNSMMNLKDIKAKGASAKTSRAKPSGQPPRIENGVARSAKMPPSQTLVNATSYNQSGGIAVQNSINKEVKPEPNPKSLYGLYMEEFADKVKDRATVKIEVKTTRPGLKGYQAIYSDFELQRTIYMDYDAHSEFIGFYLSQSPFTYDICASLPEKITDILQDSKNFSLGIKRFGDKEIISSKDMQFSGMVYVYYEGELSLEQLGSLAAIYKNKGLYPQFRGTDYVIAKSVQEAASRR